MTPIDPIVIIGVLVGGVIALAGLFRPFFGLLVLMALHFVQPGELIPALAPFRTELVYGALLLTVFVLRRSCAPGPSLVYNRIFLGALLLVGTAVLSIPFAVWRGGALQNTIELAKLVALLTLLSSLVDSNDQLRKLLWLLVGFQLWFAVSGYRAYLHGEYFQLGNLKRAEGVNSIVGGPNELAGLLVTLLPFLIALLRCSRNLLVRIPLVGCAAFTVSVMILTGSRIGFIALSILGGYYALRSRRKITALIVCAGLLFLICFYTPRQYQQRYLTVKSYAEGGQLDESNELRIQLWKAGWKMFLDHPILGVGAGQFSTAYGLFYLGGPGPWMNPHNLLIQVACELGILGLFALAYFLAQILKEIRAVLRLKGEAAAKLNYQVAIACSVMFLGVLVISTVGHTLYRPYWYLLGGLVAANRALALSRLGKQVEAVPETARPRSKQFDPGFVSSATSPVERK